MGMRAVLRNWFARRAAAPADDRLGTALAGPTDRGAEARNSFQQGAALAAAGRLEEAVAALGHALDHRPDYAEALLLQGSVFFKLDRHEDAIDSLLLATHLKPAPADAYFQLGLIEVARDRREDAERWFHGAVERDPRHAKAHNALGAVLTRRNAFEEAAEIFQRAIAADPDLAPAHSNLGCMLITRLDRFEEGARHVETAWRLNPEDPDVICNKAMLLLYQGKLSEAVELFDRLIETGVNTDLARLNRGLARLKQGDFARGWADYEARKRTSWEYVQREFPFPEWRGEPLAGRSILVLAEQGLGDQIMFASCIPDLMGLAGQTVIECPSKLAPLFRRSFPDATVSGIHGQDGLRRNGLPLADFHVAMGSLPLHFRRSLDEYPVHDGYFRPDPGRVADWRGRLAALPGTLRVGISWRGGAKSSRQSVRSIPLGDWMPVLKRGEASFISLQYTDCRDEIHRVEREHGVRIHHWQDAIDDYDETAALVCALDLVISVQTALVHLAGALGKPVWVMVPGVSEWRYLQSGERMPWYPSARLFRQARGGGWTPVIEEIARRLAAWG